MSAMSAHVHPICAAFEPLIGLTSWSVKKGHGSFVTMEFGDPERLIIEREDRGSPSPWDACSRLTLLPQGATTRSRSISGRCTSPRARC